MAGTPAAWTNTATLTGTVPYVEYSNGVWFALASSFSTSVRIYHSTDPRTSSWSLATRSPYSTDGEPCKGVVYVDGEYITASFGQTASAPIWRHYVHSSSDLSSWTDTDIGVTASSRFGELYDFLQYVNGYFTLGGTDATGAAFYFTTDYTSAWTKVQLSGAGKVLSVAHEDGYFYALTELSGGNIKLWRCTTINGTWAVYHDFTGYNRNNFWPRLKYWPEAQLWAAKMMDAVTGWDGISYATTLDGTWSFAEAASSTSVSQVYALANGGGYWVVVGQTTGPSSFKIGYAQSSTPNATFSGAGTYSGSGRDVEYADREFVVAGGDGGRIFCMTGGPLRLPGAPSLLRQRQSPRRSPSRVDYPALRQRQSPFIR